MGDSERGRGGFRRRKFFINRDKDKERHARGRDRCFDRKEPRVFKEEEKEMKRPIILTKPKPETDKDKSQEPSIQPTILLKTREGESRTVSPNPPSSPMPRLGEGATNANYQIATKSPAPPDLKSLLIGLGEMKKGVKLIEDMCIKDGILEFLTDQTEYLVVGCLGTQGIGKSYLLSRIAYPHRKSRNVFGIQEKAHSVNACTEGIDVYITGGRVILLDSQSICTSAIDKAVKKETEDCGLFENDLELQAYQYTAFLMSVCHILLFVQDKKGTDSFCKFLLSAEKMKPVTTTQGLEDDEFIEYAPQLVFVHNQCEAEMFSWRKLKSMQETYRKTFANSKLQFETGLGITTGTVIPTLDPEICQSDPLNIFLLPPVETKAELKNLENYRGHLGYFDLVGKFRQQIFAAEPMPLTHTMLSERNWYHYAVKVWENIKKNSNYSDYLRPLPSWSIMKERNSYGK